MYKLKFETKSDGKMNEKTMSGFGNLMIVKLASAANVTILKEAAVFLIR